MNQFKASDTEKDIVEILIQEFAGGSELKLQRYYKKPDKNADHYTSNSLLDTCFAGSYYYQMDDIMNKASKPSKVTSQQIEDLRGYLLRSTATIADVPSLQEITSGYFLKRNLSSSFQELKDAEL